MPPTSIHATREREHVRRSDDVSIFASSIPRHRIGTSDAFTGQLDGPQRHTIEVRLHAAAIAGTQNRIKQRLGDGRSWPGSWSAPNPIRKSSVRATPTRSRPPLETRGLFRDSGQFAGGEPVNSRRIRPDIRASTTAMTTISNPETVIMSGARPSPGKKWAMVQGT